MIDREAGYTVEDVEALDCSYAPAPWRFATERAEDVARHWADAVRERPLMFDGRVLMQAAGAVERPAGGPAVFRANYTDVAFSAFLAWRDFGRPTRDLRNGFGMAALQGADGAFVLGEMGAHTANAGRVYFPSGTPDLDDVDGARVDIVGSIRRELEEETGLDAATLVFEPRFSVVQDVFRTCLLQRVRAPEPAASLAGRITDWLATLRTPELMRMHVVRGVEDLTPAMPPFVTLYLRRAFEQRQPG